MHTPEFLVWAIGLHCPLRGFEDGSHPERTERQIRAARAIGDARRAGRLFAGWCLEPPDGFRIEEALAVYGGLAAVERACRGCPANAGRAVDSETLANCYGVVPLPAEASQVYAATECVVERVGIDRYERLFPATSPRWHGLWINSPLATEQQEFLVDALTESDGTEPFISASADLRLGLRAAIDARLPLHVRLYPRGRVEDGWWRLVTHCPRCKAEWNGNGIRSVPSTYCRVCGYAGHSAPDKKRRARGRRPYAPLTRLLGEERAAELLTRYEQFRA